MTGVKHQSSGPATPAYSPPPIAKMRETQDSEPVLRLLLAQRRRYSRAKRWLNGEWLGMLVIALAAPLVSIIWPDVAVAAGAVAGVWIFGGRSVVKHVHGAGTTTAASIQERLDQLIFEMPMSVSRSTLPLEEEIAAIVGPPDKFDTAVTKEKLRGWYTFEDPDPVRAVAIAQRSNLAYSRSLLVTTAGVWITLTSLWVVFLVVLSRIAELSLEDLLVGVLLPVLPAGLDVFEYIVDIHRQARAREDLARSLEDRLRGVGDPLTADQLLVWQDGLFYLRDTPAHVPDRVYKMVRRKKEQQMNDAVNRLSNSA